MKKLRTFVIPAKAGIGAKKFYKYLIGARCARFRVPIPACAGMTIFVNKNCKKYFADEKDTNEISLEDTVIQKLPPEIIKGKGQSVAEGEKKALSFTSNAAFSDFIRVELDGKTLDEKNYIVKEGSTIVTLKADYVATLSAGEHTIGIVSTNGTATTTFTVNAKAVVDNDTKSPQTGDNSHMALWIALLFVSGAGVIGTTVYGKKKKANKILIGNGM